MRLRLLPAVLTALGIALLATGLMSYTNVVEAPPVARVLASYEPLPTPDESVTLPGSTEAPGSGATPTFPPDRVATRIAIRRLDIDLPVMLQTDNYGTYPLCDVAMYQPAARASPARAARRTSMPTPARACSCRCCARRRPTTASACWA